LSADRDTEAGEWVVYHPPKSVAFGHQSRPRDPRLALPIAEKFLNEWAQYLLGDRIELTCHELADRTSSPVGLARLAEARQRFGPELPTSPRYPTFPRWELDKTQLQSAIQFALDDDKFPKQKDGPTTLRLAYYFTWKLSDWIREFPPAGDGRDSTSHVGLTIGGQRLFVQPFIVFPLPWDSPMLHAMLARLEPTIPFRFRDQYFARWLRPRSPSSYGRHLKLKPGWKRLDISI